LFVVFIILVIIVLKKYLINSRNSLLIVWFYSSYLKDMGISRTKVLLQMAFFSIVRTSVLGWTNVIWFHNCINNAKQNLDWFVSKKSLVMQT